MKRTPLEYDNLTGNHVSAFSIIKSLSLTIFHQCRNVMKDGTDTRNSVITATVTLYNLTKDDVYRNDASASY